MLHLCVTVPFSVLDLAPIGTGMTAGEALRNTLTLAKHVEKLGYNRFWLAEHHSMPGIASSAPAIMIGQVAAVTERLRVGSGGVMLPNHAPLVVAEQFGTLEALFPGRVDLGHRPGARHRPGHRAGPAPRQRTPERRGLPPGTRELTGFVDDDFPPTTLPGITAVPGTRRRATDVDARVEHLQRPGRGHARAAVRVRAALLPRRDHAGATGHAATFNPSETLDRPVHNGRDGSGLPRKPTSARNTSQRRHKLAILARQRAGNPSTYPTPEEAAANPLTPEQQALLGGSQSAAIVGSPDTVRAGLDNLLELTAADEIMVATITHDITDRLRSFEIVAELTSSLARG